MQITAAKICLTCFLLYSTSVCALDYSVLVTSSGKPAKDTVVTLTPVNKVKPLTASTYIIDQINKTYVPHVKVIPVGSEISFPNKDDIRHHVYSFSDTKKFELPLYEGTPANPVIFNQAGIVTLGCNIHDWMRAYIYVTDASYFGLSNDAGEILIKNISKGKYKRQVWHPRLKERYDDKVIDITGNTSEKINVLLKPSFKIRRAPKAKRRRY